MMRVFILRTLNLHGKNVTLKSEYKWSDIKDNLINSVLPIYVTTVNQNNGATKLNYKDFEKNRLRIIAVGGDSLSRGLTLEGLIVSYFIKTLKCIIH